MTDKIAYSRHDDIVVLRIENPPVNALSQAVRQGLSDGMDRAEGEDGVRAVMIAKPSWAGWPIWRSAMEGRTRC